MLEWKLENNNKEVIILIMKCKNGKNGKKWVNNSGKVIKKIKRIRPRGRSSLSSGVGNDDNDKYCIVKEKRGNVNNDVMEGKKYVYLFGVNFLLLCVHL